MVEIATVRLSSNFAMTGKEAGTGVPAMPYKEKRYVKAVFAPHNMCVNGREIC